MKQLQTNFQFSCRSVPNSKVSLNLHLQVTTRRQERRNQKWCGMVNDETLALYAIANFVKQNKNNFCAPKKKFC